MKVHISHVKNTEIGMQEYQSDLRLHENDRKFELLKEPVIDYEFLGILPRRNDSIILGEKYWFVVNAQWNLNLHHPTVNIWVDDHPMA